MSSEEIFEKVKKIIVEQLGVAETSITMKASFIDDLGADSLDIVELIMALEEEFDMEIPDEDDLQKMLEGNFDYDDYLNDWVLNIENKSQNITTNQLINYYQRDPEKAWSNVNDLDLIVEEVQESEY